MTKLSADAQTEYRLDETCGCAVDYRLANDQPLEWIGQGLRDVGIEPGSLLLTDDDRDDARALVAGCDPGTGEQLVDRKQVLDPRGKLAARTFVDAMRAAAEAAGTTPAGLLDHGTAPKTRLKRYAQLERGLVREGDAHKVPVKELGVLARAAGLDLDVVYGADRVATAMQWASAKVTIGNMGFDVTLECPKTLSVVAGTAPTALGKALRDTYMEAARESVAYLEDTCGYAMAGHHGDGQRAERRDTSGLLGWAMLHQAARPVPDAPAADAPVDGDRADEDGAVDEDQQPRHSPGDPHLHVHLTLVNMAHADDGKWRTIAAGGRDLHRHARVADAYNEARMRALTARRFGMRWERRVPGGAWEVVGVPEEMRVGFSRRSTAIAASIATKGLGPGAGKSVGSATRRAKLSVTEDETRAVWRERGTALAGRDVDLVVAEAAPGWDGPHPTGPGTPPGGPPRLPSPTDVAARIWDPETGLTSHRKVVTRVDVLAAVLEECGEGVENIAQAQALTDQVLDLTEWVVPLPGGGQRHMSDAARYTTVDIVEAEKTVTAHAIAGMRGRRFAAVPVDVAAAAVEVCETTQQWRFSPEQLAVLDRFLTAGNAIESLVGVAGAGKTSLMTAARTGWEARDLIVAGASTASVAAENLFRESAIPARSSKPTAPAPKSCPSATPSSSARSASAACSPRSTGSPTA
ncbi:relaxase domain-containing protein [Streptomyces sp. SID3343]|nr:relaxase domain-containing protein [Streptomyces sp. SID3343]